MNPQPPYEQQPLYGQQPYSPPQGSQQHPNQGTPQYPPLPSTYYPPEPWQQPPMMPPPMPPMKQSMAEKAWDWAWRWPIPALIIVSVLAFFLLTRWLGGSTFPTTSTPHNAGMSEQQYKDMTTYSTVANLDKDGNNGAGMDVHFIATILNFVKDSSGNTAGANVTDPDTVGSVIQVEFPSATNVNQLNTGDRLEVWGTDGGTFTATNAFGVTVHEVFISALYMSDQTTGYSVG